MKASDKISTGVVKMKGKHWKMNLKKLFVNW